MFKDLSHKKAQKTAKNENGLNFAPFVALFEIRWEIDVDFWGVVRRWYQE